MIELLGVGVRGGDGRWLLHRVCARWAPGQLVLVVSESPAERLALLDTVAGAVVPEEGRAWLYGIPLSRETAALVRSRAGDVDLRLEPAGNRSVLWNTLAAGRPGLRTLRGLLRLPRPGERQAAMSALSQVGLDVPTDPADRLDREGRARLSLARALLRGAERLVVRDADVVLGVPDAERLLAVLRSVTRADRLLAVGSVSSLALARRLADRVAVITDGLLVLDAVPGEFTEDDVAWRFKTAARRSAPR